MPIAHTSAQSFQRDKRPQTELSEQNTPHLKKGLWKTMTENSLFVFLVCLGSLGLLERCARMTPQLFTFSFIFISMAFVSWDYYCHLESPEIV